MPEQPAVGVGGLQDPAGVPSAADGRIDLEAARVRRESQDDLLKHHGQVPYFLFHQRSDRPDGPPGPRRLMWSLDAQALEVLGEHLRLVHLSASTGPTAAGTRARVDRERRPPRPPSSSPANSRRTAGRTKRPWRSSSTSNAVPKRKRWKVRALWSVTGRAAVRSASASQSARGKSATQPSIHLLDLGPLGELGTEADGDGEASLVVDRVAILTCEHGAGLAPTVVAMVRRRPGPSRLLRRRRGGQRSPLGRHGGWPSGPLHLFSPLCTTLCHLDGHDSGVEGPVKGYLRGPCRTDRKVPVAAGSMTR